MQRYMGGIPIHLRAGPGSLASPFLQPCLHKKVSKNYHHTVKISYNMLKSVQRQVYSGHARAAAAVGGLPGLED